MEREGGERKEKERQRDLVRQTDGFHRRAWQGCGNQGSRNILGFCFLRKMVTWIYFILITNISRIYFFYYRFG